MEAKMRAAAALVTVLCCGCNQQRLTPDSCVVHMSSTFAGTGSAQGQITVAKNGAPCGIAFVMNGPSGGGFVSDPVLTTEPAHGSASARMSNGAALIFYSPSPDYIGPDRFVVGFSRDYTLTVGVSPSSRIRPSDAPI
jgi:hypothetical protein